MSRRMRRILTLALVAILLIGGVIAGAAGCNKKDADSVAANASVTEKDSGFFHDLLNGDKEEEETKAEPKGTSTTKTTASTVSASQTASVTQESSSRSDTAPATTLSAGLFQVSQDYKASHNYCLAVNTAQNIVIVYAKGADGNYTVPVRAMTASCGRAGHETPSGQYTTLARQRWLYLIDGTYGQYCTKFKEHYWFHSVPYYTQDPSNLEWPEYNKLGSNASAGCVRLCVRDVKWIYDNVSLGTVVRVYSSSAAEPLAKPAPVRIDTSDTNEKRGWDPTDPDSANPYH